MSRGLRRAVRRAALLLRQSPPVKPTDWGDGARRTQHTAAVAAHTLAVEVLDLVEAALRDRPADEVEGAGCWVVRYHDLSAVWVFGTELDAQRCAAENAASAVFVPWGEVPR